MLNHRYSNASIDEILSEDNILAALPFSECCKPSQLGIIQTGLVELGHSALTEVWSVEGKVVRGVSNDCHWSKSNDLICVASWLDNINEQDLEQSFCDAYLALFEVFKAHGFNHPFRFWNYIPKINNGDGDREVYKRFCSGRLQAFNKLQLSPEKFPSASALGHHDQNRAVVFGLASAVEPTNLGNNKQVHAYNYPRQYGISSPSFTRATSIVLAGTPYLFISGTASIIGHKTVELGNLQGQLKVTIDNITHLLETANPHQRKLSTLKVYLRHSEHFAQTYEWLEKRFPNLDIVITLADICREDLLVEIECFCR